MSIDIDPVSVSVSASSQNKNRKSVVRVYQPQRGEQFLKGPIPWPWLLLAGQCKGKALHVAISLWRLVGLTKSPVVDLNQSRLISFGVSRDAARRGLRSLEMSNLVSVERKPGRRAKVTLILNERTLGRSRHERT